MNLPLKGRILALLTVLVVMFGATMHGIAAFQIEAGQAMAGASHSPAGNEPCRADETLVGSALCHAVCASTAALPFDQPLSAPAGTEVSQRTAPSSLRERAAAPDPHPPRPLILI